MKVLTHWPLGTQPPTAGQHPLADGGTAPGRGWRQAAQPAARSGPGRACRTGAAPPPGSGAGGGTAGMAVGPAGPIHQAGLALLAIAGPPAISTGTGDPHLGRDRGDRAASRDTPAQDHPSDRGEAGVSVGPEDLQQVSRQTAPPRRRSSPHVNNLMLSTASPQEPRLAE